MASVMKAGDGSLISNSALKVVNGTSLDDYAPDPSNFAES
jgi:hypothetical protein